MPEGQTPPPPPTPPTEPPPPPPPPGYEPPRAAPAPAPSGRYPIDYEVEYATQRNRLTTFFRIIFAIPWAIVGAVYEVLAAVFALAAWVALVITGHYPRTLYEWKTGILRYHGRFGGFLYLATDAWPPFGWAEDPHHPQRVPVAPPAASQSRLKAFFRLILAVPLFVVVYALGYILQGASIGSWLVIVFRGYQPSWLQNTIVAAWRWHIRAAGYLLLLTDIYPPVGDEAPALAAATA